MQFSTTGNSSLASDNIFVQTPEDSPLVQTTSTNYKLFKIDGTKKCLMISHKFIQIFKLCTHILLTTMLPTKYQVYSLSEIRIKPPVN